jgi:hypothetical protein
MKMPILILLINLLSTVFMVGLIWVIQVVHYPLFDDVGAEHYERYQSRHQTQITYIVGPMMLTEAATTILLAWYRPDGVDAWLVFAGIGLMFAVWLSTAVLQVPCHGKLINGFDQSAYDWLVKSNWIRTIAWSARGAIATWMLVIVLSKTTSH